MNHTTRSAHSNLVALAGDWHGNDRWAHSALNAVAERGIRAVFHLGDFGIWPGRSGVRYLAGVDAVCADHGPHRLRDPGNHEDWNQLVDTTPDTRDDLGALWWLSDHVAVFPRDPSGIGSTTVAARSSPSAGRPAWTSPTANPGGPGGARR